MLTLLVDRLDDDGRGVGRAQEREIHVLGGLPGEEVRVEVEHQSPHAPRGWGRVVEVLRASPERVPAACAAHGQCGGCSLQHLSPAGQLAFKLGRARAALEAAGVQVPVAIQPASAATGTRNRAKWIVATGPSLASYAPGSHRPVDMAGCQALEPALARAQPLILDWLRATGLAVHEERTRQGELRYVLARANHAGQVLVLVVTHSTAARPALAARPLDVAGLHWQVNPSTGGALLGPGPVERLHGIEHLVEEVGPVQLVLSPTAFFQVERTQAARMYARAASAVSGRVVDLYCGVGGFALSCAARGAQVIGVESLPAAVRDAEAGATRNGLPARFLVGDAAEGLPAAIERLGGLDGLITDPPRKGLGPAARAAILAAAPPRLVLVSCEPRSLTADLAALLAAGYRVEAAEAYDLMPGTPEVETLVVLER